MRKLIFILTIITCSCQLTTGNKSKGERVSPPKIEFDKNIEINRTVNVYQNSKDNNKKGKLVKTVNYYQDSLKADELYNGYKESKRQGKANTYNLYDYRNNKLVQIRKAKGDTGDSTKTIIYYNNKDQVSKEVIYYYTRRIPINTLANLDKSNPTDINDIVFEEERSWDILSTKHFKYDSEGRKIETYEPISDTDSLTSSSQNRYTWMYNDDGKISEHSSYDQERLIWKEVYYYSKNEYYFKRIWYDHEGKPRHLTISTPDFPPIYSFHFKLDNKGREIERVCKSEMKNFENRYRIEYNSNGEISKRIVYDINNEVELVHNYEYKEKSF